MSGELVAQFKPAFAVNEDNKEVLRLLTRKVADNEQVQVQGANKYRLVLKKEYW